jgi:hypothetical protein
MNLPVEIWIDIMKNLGTKDLNNIHLTCKKFHEIASNHVLTKLKLFYQYSDKSGPYPLPDRLCDSLEIYNKFLKEEFEFKVEKVLRKSGFHIKKIKISHTIWIL